MKRRRSRKAKPYAFNNGGINGHYLRNIIENAASDTEEVFAAVAYAVDSSLLFDWCWKKKIPLKYYGRLDEGVAVSVAILTDFLKKKSPIFVCRLVQHIMPKSFGGEVSACTSAPPT